MTSQELKEQLAAIEHERWSHWQRYLHDQLEPGFDDFGNTCLYVPMDKVDHWENQIATPYAQLSEREKESDREQVEKYWPLIEAYIIEKTAQVAEAEGVIGEKD